MSDECKLVLLEEGKKHMVACLDMNQKKHDFLTVLEGVEKSKEILQIKRKIVWLADGKKSGSIKYEFKGIWTLKHGQIRLPFFYHTKIPGLIVIIHFFQKKSDKWSQDQKKRALERKKLANGIVKLTPLE